MIIKPIVYAPYKSGGKFPYPVKDIMLPYSETYNGNVVIKKARAKTDLTNDHILEIYKCSKDPIYFIENYCRIISLDEGLVPFKMYEFQKDMIKLYTENRYSLALTSRQLGKCFSKTTSLNIRNAKTGEIYENITAVEFYEWRKFCQFAESILRDTEEPS